MRLSNDRDQLMAATPMLGLLSGFILLLVALVFVIFCAMLKPESSLTNGCPTWSSA